MKVSSFSDGVFIGLIGNLTNPVLNVVSIFSSLFKDW